jgi:hypothetical protein
VIRQVSCRKLRAIPQWDQGDTGGRHGTLGLVELLYKWDYAAAASELASIKDEESALTVLSCTSHLMAQTGQTRGADEMVHRMLRYDPQSAQLIGELGCIDYYRAVTTRTRCGTIARRWRQIHTRRYRIGD